MPTLSPVEERQLLEAARHGDEGPYQRLVEAYRSELHAHCYRMLGSTHDAEDALQEALLRAWRGIGRFEGRSSLRSWLYTIATNTCLNAIQRRPKRVLPIDYAPSSDPADGPGLPLVESVWVEPYPDGSLQDGVIAPEARYEQRESVELAFIAALQLLPSNQRAVLILREVLGFSAAEVAEALGTSVPSVNSALQRARKTIDDKLPERSQQETLRTLGDEQVRATVDRFMQAMVDHDIDGVMALLAEDAAWSMPPAEAWFTGPEDLLTFLQVGPLSGSWRWAHRFTTASGQPCFAAYTWDEDEGCYLAFALNVLTFADDGRIADVTSFIVRQQPDPDPERYRDWPTLPPDPERVRLVFEECGVPARLSADEGRA